MAVAAIAAAGFIFLILSRNTPRKYEYPEQTAPSKQSSEFTAPSKTNVTPSYSERVEMLKKSVAENPSNASHLIALAQLLMDGHQNKEAIRYFEKGVKLQPTNDSLLLDLSVCYFNEHDYANALKITDKILSFSPGHPRGLYNKGAIYAAMNRNDEAIAVWNILLRTAPQSDEAKSVRGHISMLEKK
ncbi:MAG: tetratricopeptide repeat protein [Bacteroidota bacterium]